MKMTQDGYFVNRHSCFLLEYHLVLVTKYRKPVISGGIKDLLESQAKRVFEMFGCEIEEFNSDEDHIHILFRAVPDINLRNLISNYKTTSSRVVRNNFKDELDKIYTKPVFWSASYFVCTVSEKSRDIVQQYIRNQGKH